LVIVDVILPILMIVFFGFLLRRLGKLDEKAIARAQLYVLSPALVFMAMARAEAETVLILSVLLYTAVLMGVILGIVQGIAFIIKRDRIERHAMSLAAVFMNAGFYGIPVCLLAFGDMGLVYATTFVVTSAAIQSTLGIFLASAGSRKASDALVTVFKVPLIYSIVLARLLAHFDSLPPEPFMKMINLLGQAAIPLGLILLGMQLERIISASAAGRMAPVRSRTVEKGSAPCCRGEAGESAVGEESLPVTVDEPIGRRDLASGLLSAALRIVGGFAVSLIILKFFDFDPLLRKVLIVESSMPTAVHTVVYATEFNCRPRLVAVGVLGSTLASILSVTLILNYLG
jgi:predicted permease